MCRIKFQLLENCTWKEFVTKTFTNRPINNLSDDASKPLPP